MSRFLSAAQSATVAVAVREVSKRVNLPSWDRPSYRGTDVSLTGGLQVTAGTLKAAWFAGDARTGALIATAAGAGAGYVDDHLEEAFPARGKGFKGHLGALKHGQVTSGLLKIGVIGLGSVAAAATLPSGKGITRVSNIGLNSLLIASTANLINLLDLRPGRALKAIGAASAPFVANSDHGAQAAGLVATSLASMPSDLAGETMLGDLGANAVGAQLGVLLAASSPSPVRIAILATNVGLTYASEKVSFSKIIESNPVLSRIDSWGR